jgi:hypothetical protein
VTKASGTSDWRKLRSAALLVRLSLGLKSDCLRPRRKKTVSITEGPPESEKAKRRSCLRDEFQCRGIFGEGIYVSDVDCDLRQRDRAGSRSSSTPGGREGVIWQGEDQNEATLADMERERRGIPPNDPRRTRPGGYQAVEERRSLDRFCPWEARRLGTSPLN